MYVWSTRFRNSLIYYTDAISVAEFIIQHQITKAKTPLPQHKNYKNMKQVYFD